MADIETAYGDGRAHTVVVVPCFDEAARLDVAPYRRFAADTEGFRVLFVDDGSRDATAEVLAGFCAELPEALSLLRLERNVGKAEAVRRGFLEAFRAAPDFVGFLDADLATPLDALPRFLALLREKPELDAVIGSRVKLLGRDIERHAWRHYFGRVFATCVSLTLRMPVYDTQCGAKLFRRTSRLEDVFSIPFLSRWIFDVEIIARLDAAREAAGLAGAEHALHEYPLERWSDVAGSKVRLRDFARAAIDLARIRAARLRR